jgi:hypothetical protein
MVLRFSFRLNPFKALIAKYLTAIALRFAFLAPVLHFPNRPKLKGISMRIRGSLDLDFYGNPLRRLDERTDAKHTI